MYIGLAADPTWIQEVFGVQTAAQIDIDKTRLLDRETPASQRVRTVIGMWDYIQLNIYYCGTHDWLFAIKC